MALQTNRLRINAYYAHLIVNPKDGRIKEFTGQLKSISAKAIINSAKGIEFEIDSEGLLQVWQESFKAIPLWSTWSHLAEDQLHSCQSSEGQTGFFSK